MSDWSRLLFLITLSPAGDFARVADDKVRAGQAGGTND